MAADRNALVADNGWNSVNNDEQKQNSSCLITKFMTVRGFFLLLFGLTVLVTFLIFLDGEYVNSEMSPQHQDDIKTILGNRTLAEYLESEVRVLCWIMTNPKSHKTRALQVKNTWGKRCTKLLFVTTQEDPELDTLIIDIEEKYENLWGKTRNTFKYLYENHLEEFDWFMKADDDTYVFIENLRYMLYPYSPDMPVWFGCNFKLGGKKNERHLAYMSGGSGYTLSREALRRFGSVALKSPNSCKINADTGAEDAEMGWCLNNAKVIAADSRDKSLKFRYSPFTPDGELISHLWPEDFWYQKLSFFHTRMSRESMSNYAVAFHYVTPEEMHMYEYLKYEFEAVGLSEPEESLPRKLRFDEVIAPISNNDLGHDD